MPLLPVCWGKGGVEMTLLQMRYILEVERCGSMNRAAQDLFISQSALSTAILEVEKELGITISAAATGAWC